MAEAEKSERYKRRKARMQKITAPKRVRVVPKSDELREVLRHPRAGRFRTSGSTEWPLDQFTKRRLRDGDVTVEAREANKNSDVPQPNKASQKPASRVEMAPQPVAS